MDSDKRTTAKSVFSFFVPQRVSYALGPWVAELHTAPRPLSERRHGSFSAAMRGFQLRTASYCPVMMFASVSHRGHSSVILG